MRVAVLGAGAIGSYVGAALARGGADVVLVARGAHLDALRRDGVRVLSPRGDFQVRTEATDDFAALGDADAVFLGLKAHSLPALAPRIAEHLRPGTPVIAAQNGVPFWFFRGDVPLGGTVLQSVDPGAAISAAIPDVIGTVVYCATEIVEPGVIRHVEGTRFPLAPVDGTSYGPVAALSDAFTAGGLKAPLDRRLREQIWLKLLGNVAFNPVSALTGATLRELGGTEEMRALLRAIMEETAAVGARLDLELPVSIDRRLEAGLEVGDHKTSMLQDREAGRPLEHMCMTGAVVELAAMLGVPVPHTAAVHACVSQLGGAS